MGKIIDKIRAEAGCFVRDTDLPGIVAESRLQPLLVRCGSGRFSAPAQDVQHFITIIEREGSDYIRDVSIATLTPQLD